MVAVRWAAIVLGLLVASLAIRATRPVSGAASVLSVVGFMFAVAGGIVGVFLSAIYIFWDESGGDGDAVRPLLAIFAVPGFGIFGLGLLLRSKSRRRSEEPPRPTDELRSGN